MRLFTADERRMLVSVQANDEPRVAALDGLRGIAILAVMLFHFTMEVEPTTAPARIVKQAVGIGWSGVDLFFVLSGFLITGILLDSKERPGYFRSFYARRTLRIFPLYYATLAIVLFVVPHWLPLDTPGLQLIWRRQIWLWTYTTNLAFVAYRKVFFDSDWLHLIHLWSLAIEEQFYLVWPTMVLFASRRGVVRLCIVAIVGALALRAGLVMAHVRPGGVYFPTPCRVDALAFGALAATLSREMAAARLAQIARRILWPASLVLAGIVVWNGEWHLPSEWMMQTLGLTLLATISTCIVVMAIGAPAQSHLRRALEARWLRAFGRYSYAMYVFHVMLTSVFTPFRTYRPSATPLGELMWLFAATVPCAIVTFGLAFLSWHGFEKHLLKLKRFFPRPTERSTTSVEAQADPAA